MAFVIFFICWPLTINRMQQITIQALYTNWWWLASMGIVFAIEYFIYEPILLLLFHDKTIVRNRGGYYYNYQLGQLFEETSEF